MRQYAALDEAVAACPGPPVLVAHSLGCTTLAHWAARTPTASVRPALLVAPPDVDRVDQPELLGFRPVPPFPPPPPVSRPGDQAAEATSPASGVVRLWWWWWVGWGVGVVGVVSVRRVMRVVRAR
ncbi:alpha/beta hydrolase, partial [Streptomyces sp. NPDC058728]